MKALGLTCRELRHTVGHWSSRRSSLDQQTCRRMKIKRRAVQSLHRLSIALQRSPDIATFFKNINIRWMPYGFQRYEAEALFSFVLDRPLPELGFVSITVHGIEFPDLASCIQHSLLRVLTVVAAPKITYVNVVMGSFPNTILERSRHARGMTLCGYIYLDPSRPSASLHGGSSRRHTKHSDHSSCSRRVVVVACQRGLAEVRHSHLRILHLGHGTSDIYSARPKRYQLDVFIVQGDELWALLTWLAASAAIRNPGSLEGIKNDDSSSQSSILDHHQTLWKTAADGSETRVA
ncbi:hypothetical protein BKA70DRAFT_1323770 [Coprinopsis sp. MPI-PUGE-AT-0042]|nr:hypothetical protein BKA70DRAFT_1323770 [Coprinopsis sp. MPI-PUGE-AT-0042]